MHKDFLPEICEHCHGRLDPKSREHTRADLGPWFVRSVDRPFSPGMRYETLVRQMGLGRIRSTDVVRGPTTSQFWTVARKVPGLSHHFGLCHACQAPASAQDEACAACGSSFQVTLDRDRMGLRLDHPQTSASGDGSQSGVTSGPPADQVEVVLSDFLPTEDPKSRTSSQLRRELLAARRRQNALNWLVGVLVLGVMALIVLQEIKSPGPAPSVPPPTPPAPAPQQSEPKSTTTSEAKSSSSPKADFPSNPRAILPSPTDTDSPPEPQISLEDAVRLYQRAVDTNRSPQTRQAELGALEVELVSLVASASPERKAQLQTLENLVRQAITDLQAELRLAPEASRATFPNSP